MLAFKKIIPAANDRVFSDAWFSIKAEHLRQIDIYFFSALFYEKRSKAEMKTETLFLRKN